MVLRWQNVQLFFANVLALLYLVGLVGSDTIFVQKCLAGIVMYWVTLFWHWMNKKNLWSYWNRPFLFLLKLHIIHSVRLKLWIICDWSGFVWLDSSTRSGFQWCKIFHQRSSILDMNPNLNPIRRILLSKNIIVCH